MWLLCALFTLAAGYTLSDIPIAGDGAVYLDGAGWTASSGELTVPAVVPGDIITDISKHFGYDPLYELNFKNGSLWNDNVWTYSLNFTASDAMLSSGGDTLLVFDGIKMAASIALNGVPLGWAKDQFLRYVFPTSRILLPGANANQLQLSFNISVLIEGRFMACTGERVVAAANANSKINC